MRRAAMIVLGIGIAVGASGKPRPPERPLTTTEAPQVHSAGRRQFTSTMMSNISTTFQDTIYFGGTTWAADSLRWEALKDSVWTFDSGVGSWINTGQLPGKPNGYHGAMEGWTGLYALAGDGSFQRSTTCAISGSYSLWAGIDSATAVGRCYAGGQGYGNNWQVSRSKSFFYPGSGNVYLSYDYAVDTHYHDELIAMVDTTGTGSEYGYWLTSHSGQVSGHDSLTLSLAEGSLPASPGNIEILFFVYSGSYRSDRDGQYNSTCGHTVIDNIRLSGAISDFSDFESGEDGWIGSPEPPPGTGDLSHLAAIPDLPPMQVPGPCGVRDSVLVFHDATFRIPWTENWAVSPWIDLRRNGCLGRPGKFLTYDLYSEYFWWPNGDNQFVVVAARSRPAPPCSDFGRMWREFDLGPWCTAAAGPVTADLSGLIDLNAEQVQIAIGVFNTRGTFSQSTDTPWFDNVRFGVHGVPTSDVPEMPKPPATALTGAEPNPLHSSTRINFTISSDRQVLLEVFDVAGRLVRTLVNSPLPAGPNTAIWDARDNSGRRVPTGLYFYRLTAGNFTAASKLIVLR